MGLLKECKPTIGWPDLPFPPEMRSDWEAFFKYTHPNIIRDGYSHLYREFFTGNLCPLQYRDELAEMMATARKFYPSVVMEIGCDRCSGFYHWCTLPNVNKVIGSEIRGTPFSDLFEKNFPDIDFCWVGDSRKQEELDKIEAFLDGDRIDILFIDGDKCFYREDFETYLPVMNPNGIVFMHDVVEGYPKEAFDRLGKTYYTRLIRNSSAYAYFHALGRPPQTAYEEWLNTWKGGSCGVGVIYLSDEKRM